MRFEEVAKQVLNIVDKYGRNYEEKEIIKEIAKLIEDTLTAECNSCEFIAEEKHYEPNEPDFTSDELD